MLRARQAQPVYGGVQGYRLLNDRRLRLQAPCCTLDLLCDEKNVESLHALQKFRHRIIIMVLQVHIPCSINPITLQKPQLKQPNNQTNAPLPVEEGLEEQEEELWFYDGPTTRWSSLGGLLLLQVFRSAKISPPNRKTVLLTECRTMYWWDTW